MAEGFPLGVAIGNEFATIAALLSSGGLGNIVSIPPGPMSTVPTQAATTPASSGAPAVPTSPPGALPLPPGAMVNLPIPPVNNFGNLPNSISPCPVFTPADYAALLNYQQQAAQGTAPPAIPAITPSVQQGFYSKTIAVGQFLEANDDFQFVAWSNSDAVTVSFYGRIEGPDGDIRPFNYTIPTTTNGTLHTITVQTGPGFLLNASASIPPGTTLTGQVNALGMIGGQVGGAFVPHTLLFAGQLSATQPLSNSLASPTSPVTNPVYKQVTLAGGGAALLTQVITPTTGKSVRFTYLEARCTASAVAGDREVGFAIGNGSVAYCDSQFALGVPASKTAFIKASISGQNSGILYAGSTTDYVLNSPLPQNVYFSAAVTIFAGFFAPFAGDTTASLKITYEET